MGLPWLLWGPYWSLVSFHGSTFGQGVHSSVVQHVVDIVGSRTVSLRDRYFIRFLKHNDQKLSLETTFKHCVCTVAILAQAFTGLASFFFHSTAKVW